jgi:predicted Zn-dependent peptidase
MTIHTFTFPNGFRLIYESAKHNIPVSTIYAFCELGSIYEYDNVRGVSHFIEHMCFKGTKKIPHSKDIFKHYDKIGAYFNAFTEKQFTCYTIKTQDEFVHNCISILSDIMLNSVFNKKDFFKELKVVVEENVKNTDDSENIISDMMNKLLYNGTSYENPIDTIDYHYKKSFNYNEVVNIYKQFYRPDRMVISIISNVPFNKIINAIKHTHFIKTDIHNLVFSSNACINIIDKSNPFYINHNCPEQSKIQYNVLSKKGINTTYIMVGFRTCSQYSNDKYVLNLLNNILGGTMGSRLFMILREQNGLTYNSTSNVEYFDNFGSITIFTKTDPSKLLYNNSKTNRGVLPLIISVLNDLIKNGITQKELKLIQGNMKGKVVINLDDDAVAEYNGTQMLLYCKSELIPYNKIYDTFYNNITVSQVNSIITKYIKKERMSVCLIGGEKIPSLKLIQKECEKIY